MLPCPGDTGGANGLRELESVFSFFFNGVLFKASA